MTGARDLLRSERGTFCVVLVGLGLVLVLTGKITADAWLSYTKWIAMMLVASKTLTTASEKSAEPDSGDVAEVIP